jgi:virginiamycin B lyase
MRVARLRPAALVLMAGLLLASIVMVAGGCRLGADAARDTAQPRGPDTGGAALAGRVSGEDGERLRGVFVTVRDPQRGVAVTVFTDERGRYRMTGVLRGTYRVEAHQAGFLPAAVEAVEIEESGSELDFELLPDPAAAETAPSSSWLALLPEGETKRRFILDCTGCHQFSRRFIEKGGRRLGREEWALAVELMLSFAGPSSGFPIISPGREPDPTADWLVRHLGGPTDPRAGLPMPRRPAGEALRAVITEYDLPHAGDLPHDLALDREGSVVVTGMFRGVLYRLDPASGVFAEVPIPVPEANPRALEISPDGSWWVLLGGPMKVARHDPDAGTWNDYAIGMYPHSIARDEEGKIWFNGHFSRDPALIGSLDPTTGKIRTFDVPAATSPPQGSPIPYELRMGPDGALWGSELVGNRVFRFAPETESFSVYDMPTPHSGPRRLDVGPDGTVWVPEYAANKLARLDPAAGRITEYPLPTPDALPYVARVDPATGAVWVAEAGADALARFDPRTRTFVEYRLPSSPALIRHMDIDPETGAVWAASSQAPPAEPKIIRLEEFAGEEARRR